MKQVGKFNSKDWGAVRVLSGNYLDASGPLAIALELEDGEPLAVLSVNMYRPQCSQDSRDLPADCFYVKDWSENEKIAAEALASGLFKVRDDLPGAASGFVYVQAWQLIGAGA